MKIVTSNPSAIARIRGGQENPCLKGVVRFYQLPCGVLVEADLSGLPMDSGSFLGFHIHEGTRCGGENFSDTGNHFNPENRSHPMHAGDLPPLLATGGRAYLCVLADRFCLPDVLGRTVVIHAMADDLHTQPSGNSGAKIGCGVIISAVNGCPRKDICSHRKERC